MRRWRMGRTNAAVLPLPVIAQASRSRPSIAGGIASVWMGVGRVKPSSLTPLRRSGWSWNDEKDMGFWIRFQERSVREGGPEEGSGGTFNVSRMTRPGKPGAFATKRNDGLGEEAFRQVDVRKSLPVGPA